ncbi:DoxX family membrane protein [Catenulispora sp. NF23]|uniref:DoxX family membrane protein n=1 Tax=Catenulispora pinistramenti TaxID=2705254 RepID=A0ABS5KM94_9ACTN|nr:DoxX family membrane protein [Catenulispora pinistramenti]MBS2531694.1 DoxX family membrane protein [Catenulispora pinistramenti]MBS2547135.1 DoxX family membrane protein [Catenulispora pinistramenti]
MTTQHGGAHLSDRFHFSPRAARTSVAAEDATSAVDAREVSIAALRIGTGFVFLWAFLDKTFGLHYSTASKSAWIHGGSPTKGFLGHVAVGPFQSAFHSMAGNGFVDWAFMLALLGIGSALIAGVGLRIAAVCGVVLVAMMWLAVYPPAQHTATGAATSSANPLVDDHVLEALALAAVAVFGTGSRLGLGAAWAKLPIVRNHRSLV